MTVPTWLAAGTGGAGDLARPLAGLALRGGRGERGVTAVGDPGGLPDQALGQGEVEAGDAVGAVVAGEPERERREGAGDRAGGAGRERGGERLAGWTAAPTGAGAHLEPGRRRHRLVGVCPWGQLGGDRVLSAGRRSDQGSAGAVAQVELEAAEGDLRQVIEGGDQLARPGVGIDSPGEADRDPQRGALDHDVDREQRAEGVVLLLGDEDRAGQLFLEQGGLDPDAADLRPGRAAGPEDRAGGLGGDLGGGAGLEAPGERGIHRDPEREGDDRLLDVRLREGARVARDQARVVYLEIESGAGWRIGLRGGGRQGGVGLEVELFATPHALGRDRAVVGDGGGAEEDTGFDPGVDTELGLQRPGAGPRHGQERRLLTGGEGAVPLRGRYPQDLQVETAAAERIVRGARRVSPDGQLGAVDLQHLGDVPKRGDDPDREPLGRAGLDLDVDRDRDFGEDKAEFRHFSGARLEVVNGEKGRLGDPFPGQRLIDPSLEADDPDHGIVGAVGEHRYVADFDEARLRAARSRLRIADQPGRQHRLDVFDQLRRQLLSVGQRHRVEGRDGRHRERV